MILNAQFTKRSGDMWGSIDYNQYSNIVQYAYCYWITGTMNIWYIIYDITINDISVLLYLYGLGTCININIICSSFIKTTEHNNISYETTFLNFILI